MPAYRLTDRLGRVFAVGEVKNSTALDLSNVSQYIDWHRKDRDGIPYERYTERDYLKLQKV